MRRRVPPLVLTLLLFAGGTHAQIPLGVEGSYEPHPEAQKAISKLLSPYCPGFMLEVCTSREAMVLRDSMHAMALQGRTSDELVDWMLAEYGSQYLAVPRGRGSGMWAWALPPLALLAGGGVVLWALGRFAPVAEPVLEAAGGAQVEKVLSPEEEARLREAIRDLELSEDAAL